MVGVTVCLYSPEESTVSLNNPIVERSQSGITNAEFGTMRLFTG